jgi:hypothetical protein
VVLESHHFGFLQSQSRRLLLRRDLCGDENSENRDEDFRPNCFA